MPEFEFDDPGPKDSGWGAQGLPVLQEQNRRAAQASRESIQTWITKFVLFAIAGEFVVGLGVVALGQPWQDVKDVMSYCLTPLAALAGVIGVFYFGQDKNKSDG